MPDKSNSSYASYTTQTNNILSKNMALECIILKYLDSEAVDRGELLNAAASLIAEQWGDIDSFRIIYYENSNACAELNRITSKNIGAAAMVDRLLNNDDPGDLAESLLVLIQSQFNDIQTVRVKITS